MPNLPFLRIPLFPRHRAPPLARSVAGVGNSSIEPADIRKLLCEARVGGTFWAPQLDWPQGRDVLIAASNAQVVPMLIDAAAAAGMLDQAVILGPVNGPPTIPAWRTADPWEACASASRVLADADCEVALVAALLGKAVTVLGNGRFAALSDTAQLDRVIRETLVEGTAYRDPFTGGAIDLPAAVALLQRWRTQIDANRSVDQVFGIARWKRVTTDAMLWDGGPVRHARTRAGHTRTLRPGSQALAWVSRSDPKMLSALQASGVRIGDIEDGMIRSTGLGANCVPPLSIVVDAQGPHFDPAQASALETILQDETIDEDLQARAAALRARLVGAGISKYEQDAHRAAAPAPAAHGKRRVLVTGQVEDDRSVLAGGAGIGNLELLRRARAAEPDAHIIFKPHPDVEAGHRKGLVDETHARELADEVDRTSSIAALLDRVDAVHVLTSLAGFEALMRAREVFTHGVPFYAGWGLTHDLGPVPARRTRRRTLDELVAATLILYPRYLDPVTRLPCGPETLVERIAAGEATIRSPLIRLRAMQGRVKRLLQGRHRR